MIELFRHLPLLSIICCFVSVVLCSLLDSKKAKIITLVNEGLCTLAGIGVSIYTGVYGTTIYQMGHLSYGESGEPLYWYNNVIRFGRLEGLLVTVFPAVMMLCILGGMKKLEEDVPPEKEKYFFVLANLALVAILAMTYADDIFTGYVFLEISTLSSIGLIAVKEKGRTTVAAIRYMIFNLVGSGLYLIGIVLLYNLTGYFMLEKISEGIVALSESGNRVPAITCSLALIVTGLGIKSGLFPFYFWMADTYGEATTSSASIISGLISKGYIVLLLKFLTRAFGFSFIAEKTQMLDIIFILGFCGMILGSVSAIFEKRINKMIAYSSAAQIGYIYLAFGFGEIGVTAAVFQILAHTITKPLLFISARGLIDVSDHKPQFIHLRGSGKRNKFAGIGFFIGAMSMIGFPVLSGFLVKYIFFETALSSGVSMFKLIMTIIGLTVSTLLNTCYMLHTVITIYSPEVEEYQYDRKSYRNRVGYLVAVVILIVLNVVLGTQTGILELIERSLL